MKEYVVKAGGAEFLFPFNQEGLIKAEQLAIASKTRVLTKNKIRKFQPTEQNTYATLNK